MFLFLFFLYFFLYSLQASSSSSTGNGGYQVSGQQNINLPPSYFAIFPHQMIGLCIIIAFLCTLRIFSFSFLSFKISFSSQFLSLFCLLSHSSLLFLSLHTNDVCFPPSLSLSLPHLISLPHLFASWMLISLPWKKQEGKKHAISLILVKFLHYNIQFISRL